MTEEEGTGITVRAPAAVKLFGEHAVVFGRTCVAVTVGMYAEASLSEPGGPRATISLEDHGIDYELSQSRIADLFAEYKRYEINAYIERNSDIPLQVLPYATIMSRISAEHGIKATGYKVSVRSEIPASKGLGSSAATSTAFALSVFGISGKAVPDHDAIDAARDGERVIHKFGNAGLIDVPATYLGGAVSYSSVDGPRSNPISNLKSILLIDTGTSKDTHEMIPKVREFCASNREVSEELLDGINLCSIAGLEALKGGDMKALGRLMNRNQDLLRSLGVSSEEIDRVADIAIRNCSSGAKLSGKGGGGIVVALDNAKRDLSSPMEAAGYKTYNATITSIGAKHSYNRCINGR
ncbi:MAG: mevalonate kinase [Candidatus Micrarchaeota archaeon]|nr:mevalonate kinase [Candidatus Micrarchaeota archaeon]